MGDRIAVSEASLTVIQVSVTPNQVSVALI
jgi:hypothetical protein